MTDAHSNTRTPQVAKDAADVGILTVVPVEQSALVAVLDGLGSRTRMKDADGTVYHLSSITSSLARRPYAVVSACVASAGNSDAAAAATAMALRFSPSVMFLVGIAAGIRDTVRIGDVAYGDAIWGYESGSVKEGKLHSRPRVSQLAHTLAQDIANHEPDQTWITASATSASIVPPPSNHDTPGEKEDDEIALAVGPIVPHRVVIASGEKLLRDPNILLVLRRDGHDRIRVGEMEASGFAIACERQRIPALVVRGIADFGDNTKTDHYQRYAAGRAVLSLVEFIRSGLEIAPAAGRPVRADDREAVAAVDTPARAFYLCFDAEYHPLIDRVISEQIPLAAFLSVSPGPPGSALVDTTRRYHLGHAYFGRLLAEAIALHDNVALLITPSTSYVRWRDPTFNRTVHSVAGHWLNATDGLLSPSVITDFVYNQPIREPYDAILGWLLEVEPSMRLLSRDLRTALTSWRTSGHIHDSHRRSLVHRLHDSDSAEDGNDDLVALAYVLAERPSWYATDWYVRTLKVLTSRDAGLAARFLNAPTLSIIESWKNRPVWLALRYSAARFGLGSFPDLLFFHSVPNTHLTGPMRTQDVSGLLPLWGNPRERAQAVGSQFVDAAAHLFLLDGDPRSGLERVLREWQERLNQSPV